MRSPDVLRMLLIGLAGVTAGLSVPIFLGGSSNTRPDDREILRELLAAMRETSVATSSAATAARNGAADIRQMSDRMADLEAALAQSKRAAIALSLDVDTPCGDAECEATAKAICARISYRNGITSRVTGGPNPSLHSLVCFD